MKDADFLQSYRTVIRSYRLGPGPAARILKAVLRQISLAPRQGSQSPGAQEHTHRRNGP